MPFGIVACTFSDNLSRNSCIGTDITQKLKELITLSNLCNFQLFESNVEGNISHRCEIAG